MGDRSNGELQCYLPANAVVGGGDLTLTFKAQTYTCDDTNLDGSVRNGPSTFNYTSSMVQWTSFNFLYGTVEVRAQIPNTSLWPAIWLLGANCQASNIHSADNVGACNWYASGSDEVDIAEFAPNDATSRENVYANGNKSFSCGSGPETGGDGQFHVYTFTWAPSGLSWAVDGHTNCTQSNTAYVPTKPMFLMLNIASNNSATPRGLPQNMVIDYVKVTQNGSEIFFDDFLGSSPQLTCDLNGDGAVDVLDVQIALNQALGVSPCGTADLNQDGVCNVVDVQRVINAALGQACLIGP
jgi:beta-glucanase (GH16 family)